MCSLGYTFISYSHSLRECITHHEVYVDRYPHCLHFLDLLQSEHFRRELATTQCSTFIENQQILHWHLYTKKRMQFQEKLCKCPPSLGHGECIVQPLIKGISNIISLQRSPLEHLSLLSTAMCPFHPLSKKRRAMYTTECLVLLI